MDIFWFFVSIVVGMCFFGFVVFIIGQLRLLVTLNRINKKCIKDEKEYNLDKAIRFEAEKNLKRFKNEQSKLV